MLVVCTTRVYDHHSFVLIDSLKRSIGTSIVIRFCQYSIDVARDALSIM